MSVDSNTDTNNLNFLCVGIVLALIGGLLLSLAGDHKIPLYNLAFLAIGVLGAALVAT